MNDCWSWVRARSGCSPPGSRSRRAARSTSSGCTEASLAYAAAVGVHGAWASDDLPDLRWDAVVDASNDPASPARAAGLVDAGRRIVYIGLSERPSLLDTRTLAMKDVTAVGVLSGSPGLAGAIDLYASGAVDPRPLVATTVSLDEVGRVLRGERPPGAGPGPKIHVDPRSRRQP